MLYIGFLILIAILLLANSEGSVQAGLSLYCKHMQELTENNKYTGEADFSED